MEKFTIDPAEKASLKKRKKLGFIVNPIAGIGGRVGLKGSDGVEILNEARNRGAKPESPKRAVICLEKIVPIKDKIDVITYPGEMGENEARECGIAPIVVGSIESGMTTPEDTKKAAKQMENSKVDLILFAGGDGTARDICESINIRVPVIGIPAGVKIHSAVYATTPGNAGELALRYMEGQIGKVREAEVMDIDEESFRSGRVTAKLYGYLMVPCGDRLVQNLKSGRRESDEGAVNSITDYVIDNMEEKFHYIIGPGTTTRGIAEKMGLPKTLLGVDVIINKKEIVSDVDEKKLLELPLQKRSKIVVTVIGGQGYIFGRGNQQISAQVLKAVGKENIIVIATQSKLSALRGGPLLIDTGDIEVDRMLRGYYRVIVGYGREIVYRAE